MSTGEELHEKVDGVLELIRPSLQSHGGGVNLVGVTDEGIARVQLTGACAGCPVRTMTLKAGIEQVLTEQVPEIRGVEAVSVDDFEPPDEPS